MTEPNQEAVEQISDDDVLTFLSTGFRNIDFKRALSRRDLRDIARALDTFALHRRTASAQSTSGDVEREGFAPSPSVDDVGNAPPAWLAPLCDLYEQTTGDRPKSAGIFQVALAAQRPSPGVDERCPNCHVKFRKIENVDEHLASLTPAVDVDLVERVAQAIYERGGFPNPTWDALDESWKEHHRKSARAAIASMPDERKFIVGWLRQPERRQFIDMPDEVIPAHQTFDDYGEPDLWMPERIQKRRRLPTARDFADAIERGSHISATVEG